MRQQVSQGWRLFASLAVAAAVAVLVFAQASSARGLPYDFVIGSAKATFPNFPAPGVSTSEQITVAAYDGPHGPKGVMFFQSPLSAVPVARVNVTCISVSGGEAVVGGTFASPFVYNTLAISHFSMVIRDGTQDTIHPVVFRDVPRPPGFSPCNIVQPFLPIDRGNFILHDAG